MEFEISILDEYPSPAFHLKVTKNGDFGNLVVPGWLICWIKLHQGVVDSHLEVIEKIYCD